MTTAPFRTLAPRNRQNAHPPVPAEKGHRRDTSTFRPGFRAPDRWPMCAWNRSDQRLLVTIVADSYRRMCVVYAELGIKGNMPTFLICRVD